MYVGHLFFIFSDFSDIWLGSSNNPLLRPIVIPTVIIYCCFVRAHTLLLLFFFFFFFFFCFFCGGGGGYTCKRAVCTKYSYKTFNLGKVMTPYRDTKTVCAFLYTL